MNGLLQDLRYAVRQLRKSPGFATVAILTLALGIGANTAIFSLLDQALLRSLPVKEPNRLVLLRFSGDDSGHSSPRGDNFLYFSYPMYRDLRDRNSVFSGTIATALAQVGVQWHNQPELADAELISGNYFDVLGVHAALGRLIVPSDDRAKEAGPVVVLGFDYWQRRFGADPRVLNQSISINGHPFTIIGVAQPGFHSVAGGDNPAIFTPMTMKPQITPGPDDLEDRRSRWLTIVGRLKPGPGDVQARTEAQAGIDPLWHSIRAEELSQMGHSSQRFRDAFLTNSHLFLDDGSGGVPVHGSIPTTLLVVMAMCGLMMLMACVNVGGLFLVRVAARNREISVRYALGAKRGRIVQQLLSEGMLLGLTGGVAGILLAPQISALLIRTIWSKSPGLSSRLDLRMLAFNFALALLVSLLFSLAPALQFRRPDVTMALKQYVAGIGGGPRRLRQASVVVQIGLSLLLLAGAGLFARTLHNLKMLDVGFATDHLVTFTIDPRLAGYQLNQTAELYDRLLERLSALPGVRSVAATNDPELANTNSSSNISVAGYHAAEGEDINHMNVEWAYVSSGYFSTLKMPLLAGRELTDQDRAGTQKVAVVNESFARHFFSLPQNAIGQYFGERAGTVPIDIQIVGVVRDAKHATVRGEIHRTVFTPFLQDLEHLQYPTPGTLYVRTWQSPESAESAIRQAMQTLDSNLVLNKFRTMQEQIDKDLNGERVIAFLASIFGILAALMAAIGIYGVLAYSTAQRTREIGVRIAVGATRAAIVRMVMVEVLWLAGIGVAFGLPLSLLFGHAVRSQLFGISNTDPLTFGAVIVLVAAVALVSALLPARRAAKVDPMVALRYE
jgi:putative ABC transport system permease protein